VILRALYARSSLKFTVFVKKGGMVPRPTQRSGLSFYAGGILPSDGSPAGFSDNDGLCYLKCSTRTMGLADSWWEGRGRDHASSVPPYSALPFTACRICPCGGWWLAASGGGVRRRREDRNRAADDGLLLTLTHNGPGQGGEWTQMIDLIASSRRVRAILITTQGRANYKPGGAMQANASQRKLLSLLSSTSRTDDIPV
jgi:hypothetical protein